MDAAMKVADLENLSTTTMIDLYPSDLSKQVMKSIQTLSHGLSGVGKGPSERLQVVSALPCPVDTRGTSKHTPPDFG